MSDVDQLLAAFESGALRRPDVATPNLVDVARAMAAACGADSPGGLSTYAAGLGDRLGRSPHLVLVLADGLGMALLRRHRRECEFLLGQLDAELQAPFPASTAVALTSLATGEWPAAHAVTGWWTHLPAIEAPATILQFRRREDGVKLESLGVTPQEAFPAPSALPRFRRRVCSLLPAAIANSEYSRYWTGGTEVAGYGSPADALTRTLRMVEGADDPTFTYVYLPHVDHAAHDRGTDAAEVRATLQAVNAMVAALAKELDGDAAIVLTADHGHLDASPRERRRMRAGEGAAALLACAPAGDSRVLHFHVRAGEEGAFAARFREAYGEAFFLLTVDDVDELRLFGPEALAPETRARLGTFVAISRGEAVLGYEPASPGPNPSRQLSHHAGLRAEELAIPLVLAGALAPARPDGG